MKYSDMRDMVYERSGLLDKKRLGKNQKARLAQLSDQLDTAKQPPPHPPCANTGNRADWQGNVYANHAGKEPTLREARRGHRFGRSNGIKPMRSRIQRTRRKQRTGGIR